jgi:hypothetical protein
VASPPRYRSRARGSGRPSRRGVLGVALTAGAAAVLTGCGIRVGSPSARTEPAPPGPDELARERVAKDADALRVLAVRAAALLPADRRLLAAVAADHRAHATALRPAPVPGSSGRTSAGASPAVPSPSTSSTSSTSPTSSTPPSAPSATSATSPPASGSTPALTAGTALPALVRAERAAAAAATAELDRVSGDVARLLAAVAASRSLHVRALTARAEAAAGRGGVR